MIITLSLLSLRQPQVLYATGTLRNSLPHSSSKDGTRCMLWSMSEESCDIYRDR